ncbi:MAG: hypothetical protein LWW85_12115, partial [Marinilabiliales bacterium]|nr:hypothetical protein [Marinilabiliales bacterium]
MKTKKFIFFLPLLAMPFLTMAQVKVVAFPAKGFENRIRTYVDTMTIVDTHEHLTTQRGIANSKMCDFMLMLHQYSDDDIKSAGMSKPAFEQLLKDSLTVSQKWALVKPFWDNSFNTGYNRATLLAADRLFGIQEFNEATIPQLSAKIKEAYKTDWYKKVLRDLCKIEFLIDDVPERDFPDKDMMRFTQRFNYFQIDGAEKL